MPVVKSRFRVFDIPGLIKLCFHGYIFGLGFPARVLLL